MAEQHPVIVAIVTTKQGMVQSGGAPLFIAESEDHLQQLSMSLERILDAATHEVDSNLIVIVAH